MRHINQFIRICSLAAVIIPGLVLSQVPTVYWTFDTPGLPRANSAPGATAYNLQYGPAILPLSSAQGVLGNYLDLNAGIAPMGLADTIDNSVHRYDNAFSYETWFRADQRFGSGYLFEWQYLKCRLFMADRVVYVQMMQGNGQVRQFTIPLYGVGRADPHYWQDGNWHHLVLTYDASIGEVKVYLDGICPPGFSHVYGPSGPLIDGSFFYLNGMGLQYQTDLSVDEIAVYDTVVPPWMAWQHFQEVGELGIHYTFTANANVSAPVNGPVQTGGIDPYEFAPGYPNIADHSASMVAKYPVPRVNPESNLPRNVPWISDLDALQYRGSGQSLGTAMQYTGEIAKELSRYWHYYQLLGIASLASDSLNFTDPNRYHYWLTQAANASGWDTLPRFILSNWNQARTASVNWAPNSTIPHYYNTGLDTSIYLQAGAYIPRVWAFEGVNRPIPQGLVEQDGDVNQEFYRRYVARQTLKHIDLLGENGEEVAKVTPAAIQADPEAVADRNSLGNNATWEGYQALRRRQYRQLYIGEGREYLDSVNLANGRDSCKVYWYDVGGTNPFKYDSMRTINSSLMGHRRASSYMYPQATQYWRYAPGGAITSLFNIFRSRQIEMAAGDSLFNPGVSPGFSDGGAYISADEDNIRPGQYLGLLKYLSIIGADSYTPFEYNGFNGPGDPIFPGSWRIWKLSTPGYAQAISSRVDALLEEGAPMDGTVVFQYATTGQTPTRWEFPSGGLNNLIGVRRMRNSDRFLITGSIQRNSNQPGQAPKQKLANIPWNPSGPVTDSLQFEIRAQGSTYVLDLTGPDTVWYQLDAWHEWKDPCWWCRDFCIEGELPDTATHSPQRIRTWRPNGTLAGDFRNFYAYLDWGTDSAAMSYDFVTRVPEQDTLYVWLHGWSTPTANTVTVELDGSSIGTILIPSSTLGWAGGLQLPGLGIASHRLRLIPSTSGLKLEKVALMRSEQPWHQQGLTAAFAADTVCFGSPTSFTFTGAVPDGCNEMQWEFGDGIVGHGLDPQHQYAYPGRYGVTLIVRQPCASRADTISDSVWVVAPMVEAGNDTVICLGDSIQLQGQASYFFQWEEDTLMSSSIVLNPSVSPAQTTWFHLTTISPQSGCALTDSVRVTVMDVRGAAIDGYGCFGDSVRISVSGGYYVWWEPDTLLSSDSLRSPRVLAAGDTVQFIAYIADYCRCDTDTVVVTLFSYASGNPIVAWAEDSLICDGDTTTLHISGIQNPSWWPGWISNHQSYSPQVWPPEYTTPNADTISFIDYIVTGLGCLGQTVRDTVRVNVVEEPVPNNWVDTLWQCVGGSVTLPGLVSPPFYPYPPAAASYSWQPSGQVSNPSIAQPTASVAVPTTFTLTVGSFQGCPAVMELVVVPVGIAGGMDTLLQCEHDSVGVSATLNSNLAADSVRWHPGAWFADSTALNATFSAPSNGLVWADVYHAGGCHVVDTIVVVVRTPPVVTVPDTILSCAGGSVQLAATGATPVLWNPGWLLDDSTSNTPVFVASQPQLFVVASLDSFFCPGFDSVRVLLLPDTLGPDTLGICYGDTVGLSMSPACSTASWLPATHLSNASDCEPMAWPPATTDYVVAWVDSAGCPGLDTVRVVVDSLTLTAALVSAPDTLCLGNSLQLLATGGLGYSWTPATGLSNAAIGNPWAAPGATTEYVVTISGATSCVVVDSVMVSVDSAGPAGSLMASDTIICLGDTVTLIASGGTGYTWAGPIVGGMTSDSVTLAPLLTGMYVVTITDGGTCTWVDSVTVVVDSTCCDVPGSELLHNARMTDYVAANGGATNFSARHLHIVDTLWVDTTVTFFNSRFDLDVNATIVVMYGHELTTTFCLYHSACGDSVWNTLWVDDELASFRSEADTFRDARVAVTSHRGGELQVIGSWFSNSRRHILLQEYSQAHPAELAGNRFTGGAVLPPYQGLPAPVVGVEVDTVGVGVTIGPGNVFDSLQQGILMVNSSLRVVGNTFRDMLWQGQFMLGWGAGVRANCNDWGVWLMVGDTSSGGLPLASSANHFLNCPYGVYVDGVQHVRIYGNEFDSIRVRGVSARQQNKNDAYIVGNSFEDCKLGLFLGLGRNLRGHVRLNTFTGDTSVFRTAMLLDGVTYYPLDNAPYRVYDNEIDLGGDGVWVRNSDHVHVEVNEIYMRPTPLGLNASQGSHGVKFQHADTCRVYNNAIESDASNMDAVREWMRGVWVDTGPESDVSCNDVLNFGWSVAFRSLSPGMTFYHNQLTNAMDGLVLTGAGIIGDQGNSSLPSGNLWVGAFDSSMVLTDQSFGHLTRTFVRLDSTLPVVSFVPLAYKRIRSSGTLVPFFPASLTGDTLPVVCQDFPKPWSDKASILATLIALEEDDFPVWPTENKWKARHWAYNTLLLHPELTEDNEELEGFMEDMEDGATSWIVKADQSLRAAEYEDAEYALTKFSPANLVEQNHVDQKTLQILLETDPTAFGSADTAALRSIALQCPDVGGNAVWEARTLMALLGEIIDGYDCDSTSSKIARGNSNLTVPEGWVSVWPNPTSKDAWVRLGGNAAEGGTFLLHNLQGQERLRVSLNTEAATLVTLGDQPAATYFWSFVSRSGTTYRGKLVVVK